MLRVIKRTALHMIKAAGVFGLVRDSEWRQRRLLILCYHGISQQDEHLWRPALYLEPKTLEQRLKMLKDGGYAVLPFGEAVHRLYENDLGLDSPLDLTASHSRFLVERQLVQNALRDNLDGKKKDEIAAGLARLLNIDYYELVSRRMLQLMNPTEVAELATQGVDFELHTHRHGTPQDELLFRKEISDNRKRIQEITGSIALHFCYPSGVYSVPLLDWL